jgi:hypothetical protein
LPADVLATPASAGPDSLAGSSSTKPLAAIATLVMHGLLALLFFVLVSPLAMLLRVLGVDVLGLRRDDRATSYWRKTGSN